MKYEIVVNGGVTRLILDGVRIADVEFSYATNQIVHTEQIAAVNELIRLANYYRNFRTHSELPQSTRKSTL